MTKKQLKNEWKRLESEFDKKPKVSPFPPEIVKKRELLLFAQVELSEVQWAKKCKNLSDEMFHIAMYYLIMSTYYD
jgi:hypothetical protein